MLFPTCETKMAVHVCLDPVVLVWESSPQCRAINKEERNEQTDGFRLLFLLSYKSAGFWLAYESKKVKGTYKN